jgi:hypothetical protein
MTKMSRYICVNLLLFYLLNFFLNLRDPLQNPHTNLVDTQCNEELHSYKIVIYITYAVGYILQREAFSLKTKTERCKMPTALVMY